VQGRAKRFVDKVSPSHGVSYETTACAVLAEVLEFDPPIIEGQLVHPLNDANGLADSYTTYVKQGTDKMKRRADYLDKLGMGGDVIELSKRGGLNRILACFALSWLTCTINSTYQ
jgi:hypothetical protein